MAIFSCLTFPALDAIQEGYEVYVPVDAVLAAHEAALRRMEQAGVTLISRVQMHCKLQRDWSRAATSKTISNARAGRSNPVRPPPEKGDIGLKVGAHR